VTGSAGTSPVPWAGFHHVALVTPDLDATVAFYRDVLGMHAGEVRVGGGVVAARHCFVRPGADAATWGLHFFEHPGASLPRYPGGLAGLRAAGFIPGALQHVAFALPDAAAADALRARLAARGVEATPTGTIGSLQNLLFFDPHGLLLEATWPRPDAAAADRPATGDPRRPGGQRG
jgi:catechol 2,3-dioxygenase-like lactoylglutathione lyase family enzyme